MKSPKFYVERVKFAPEADKEAILREYDYELKSDSRCSVCGTQVNIDNLGAITRKQGKVIIVCRLRKCLVKSKFFIKSGE